MLALLGRELALLLVLVAVGAAPAAHLPVRSFATRLALFPAFGLAVTSSVLLTLSFVTPLEHALWFAVLPLGVLSSLLAFRRLRRERADPPAARELGAMFAVLAFALVVFSYPMAARQSLGPVGYGIFDAPGYASYIDGYQRYTSDEPPLGISPGDWADRRWDDVAWGEPWDLMARYGWAYKFQHTGSDTLPAAVSGATGWAPWTLVSPFIVVLAGVAALGTFALARTLLDGRLAASALAGLLVAGPVLFQVHIDGSQGFVAGLALLPAVLTAGILAVAPSTSATVGLGILLAGLQAVYPELLPVVVLGAVLAVAAAVWARGGGHGWRSAGRMVRPLAVAGALAFLVSPRSTPWTAAYLYGVVSGTGMGLLDSLVDYDMSLRYVPGWLAQTREFYSFAVHSTGSGAIVWDVIAPLAVAAVSVVGIAARPQLGVLAAVAVAAMAQAVGLTLVGCSYCVQRSLLSLVPVLPVLFVAGLVSLSTRGAGARAAVVGLVAVLALGIGRTTVKSERRAVAGAYMPSADLARVGERVSRLPPGDGAVLLEGFNATPVWSWADLPTAYGALRHATDRRLAIPARYNDYGGFSYLGTRPRGHPAYTPDYRYVVTRFGALETGRATIARAGPLAIQRRSEPFDVSVVRGVAVAPRGIDRRGVPWVQAPGRALGLQQGPLTFWVSGPAGVPAWIEVRLEAPPHARIVGPSGTTQLRDGGGRLVACVPTPQTGAPRVVSVRVDPRPPGLQPPPNRMSPVALPAEVVRLEAVRASARTCATPGPGASTSPATANAPGPGSDPPVPTRG